MNYLELFVPLDPSSIVNDAKFEKDFQALPHASHEWERLYSSFVRTGDVEGARRFMEQLASSGHPIIVGNVARDEVTRTKYLAVSLVAVLTRIAISSGADELESYQNSDAFLQHIDVCNDAELIASRLFETVEQIILSVRDARERSVNNLHFTRCREYIASHLSEKITINDLASLCELTPNYLSCLFKKISGMTVTDYILEQRIDVAKKLLLLDRHTTAEIASFLGFHSQSYFIERFKKKAGMTPRAWKYSCRSDVGDGL